MSQATREADGPIGAPTSGAAGFSPLLAYGASLGLVAAATALAFVVNYLIQTPNLSLIFVLPVLIAALSFGWWPAFLAALAAVAAFDLIFVEPRYSLQVASTSDLWALALLLVVAAIASTVAAQSRRRALDAQLATQRAEALHRLARLVVEDAPPPTLYEAAGDALSVIFQAPAAVLAERGNALASVAVTRGASLSAVDLEAAKWTLENNTHARAGTYPFDTAEFDFWLVGRTAGKGVVLGVHAGAAGAQRPAEPDRYVEMVGAYLAAGLLQGPGRA
jgi:two-component system sensor histidine kinase KdpD